MGPVLESPCPPDVHQIDRIARLIFDQLDEDERHEFFAGLREVWPDGPLGDDQATGQAMFNMLSYLADWQVSVELSRNPEWCAQIEKTRNAEIEPDDCYTYEELGAALNL